MVETIISILIYAENTYNDILDGIPANGITRGGKDLIFGLPVGREKQREIELLANKFFNDYKCHYITTGGHIDGCFSPIKPGLIVSINEIPKEDYTKTFKDWEVVYLEGESWFKVKNLSRGSSMSDSSPNGFRFESRYHRDNHPGAINLSP